MPQLKEQINHLYQLYPEEAKELFGDKPFELSNVLKIWVRNQVTPQQREALKMLTNGSEEGMRVIPTDTLYVTIDKEAVKQSGMMMATDTIPDHMVISLKKKGVLYKGDVRQDLCEIELELKQGEPAALQALARTLKDACGAEVCPRSKQQRAMALGGERA